MRLALQTDLALRTLMYLAWRKERVKAADVTQFFDLSQAHVAKVVNQLARLGYIRSIRGVGGGIELIRDPEDIKVGEVVLHLAEGRGDLALGRTPQKEQGDGKANDERQDRAPGPDREGRGDSEGEADREGVGEVDHSFGSKAHMRVHL